ncbi:MAG: VCBS repeat-containing protein, partial [Planctomycetota bacterium]
MRRLLSPFLRLGFVLALSGLGLFPAFAEDCNGNGVDDSVDLLERAVRTKGAVSHVVGVTPRNVLSVDVDRDGELDLVVSERHSDAFVVLRGLGTNDEGLRDYSEPVRFSIPNPAWMAAADFDGDGEQDIVTVSNLAAAARIRRGKQGLAFHDVVEVPLPGTGWAYVIVADHDGDSYSDLLLYNRFDGRIAVLYGEGDGSFSERYTTAVDGIQHPERILAADINLDGDLDLLVVGETFDEPDGDDGGIALVPGVSVRGFSGTVNVETGHDDVLRILGPDLQGDGVPDLVWIERDRLAPSAGEAQFRLRHMNQGSENPLPAILVDELSSPPNALSASDLNGDGLPEVVLGLESGEILIYLNNDDAGLQRLARWSQPRVPNAVIDLIALHREGEPSELLVLSAVDYNSAGEVTVITLEPTAPSRDSNRNGLPDECEGDCDQNGILDQDQIDSGLSDDCNENGVPDHCDLFLPSGEHVLASTTLIAKNPDRLIAFDLDGDGFLDVAPSIPLRAGTNP